MEDEGDRMKFHRDGTLPTKGEIFVFGSNLGGVHGAGAALVARQQFGAKPRVGVGPTGRAYAIPTKNETITEPLPLPVINAYVDQFLDYAQMHYDYDSAMKKHDARHEPLLFFVAAIGCGLAGYAHAQIAPMFKGAPDNVSFPDVWRTYLAPRAQSATDIALHGCHLHGDRRCKTC
jgi:hypothetical protein